jgi:DNA gyrase/topoisomerase IV subunit A
MQKIKNILINLSNSIKLIWFLLFKVKITGVLIKDDILFDTEKEIIKILKRSGFTENNKGDWVKGFIRVSLTQDGVMIGMTTNINKKLIFVSNPLYTLQSWIKYFERI